jgi:hypothetical protein
LQAVQKGKDASGTFNDLNVWNVLNDLNQPT